MVMACTPMIGGIPFPRLCLQIANSSHPYVCVLLCALGTAKIKHELWAADTRTISSLCCQHSHSLLIPCWMILNKMVKIRCLETLPTNTQSKKNFFFQDKDWSLSCNAARITVKEPNIRLQCLNIEC